MPIMLTPDESARLTRVFECFERHAAASRAGTEESVLIATFSSTPHYCFGHENEPHKGCVPFRRRYAANCFETKPELYAHLTALRPFDLSTPVSTPASTPSFRSATTQTPPPNRSLFNDALSIIQDYLKRRTLFGISTDRLLFLHKLQHILLQLSQTECTMMSTREVFVLSKSLIAIRSAKIWTSNWSASFTKVSMDKVLDLLIQNLIDKPFFMYIHYLRTPQSVYVERLRTNMEAYFRALNAVQERLEHDSRTRGHNALFIPSVFEEVFKLAVVPAHIVPTHPPALPPPSTAAAAAASAPTTRVASMVTLGRRGLSMGSSAAQSLMGFFARGEAPIAESSCSINPPIGSCRIPFSPVMPMPEFLLLPVDFQYTPKNPAQRAASVINLAETEQSLTVQLTPWMSEGGEFTPFRFLPMSTRFSSLSRETRNTILTIAFQYNAVPYFRSFLQSLSANLEAAENGQEDLQYTNFFKERTPQYLCTMSVQINTLALHLGSMTTTQAPQTAEGMFRAEFSEVIHALQTRVQSIQLNNLRGLISMFSFYEYRKLVRALLDGNPATNPLTQLPATWRAEFLASERIEDLLTTSFLQRLRSHLSTTEPTGYQIGSLRSAFLS